MKCFLQCVQVYCTVNLFSLIIPGSEQRPNLLFTAIQTFKNVQKTPHKPLVAM